jgi:hypothetical protein
MSIARIVLPFGLTISLIACAAQSHPNVAKSPEAAFRYIDDHCQNGAGIKSLSADVDGDEAVGNKEQADTEQLSLDKEYVLCSDGTNDQWLSQVTQLLAAFDSRIDDNSCQTEETKGKQDDADSDLPQELDKLAWDSYYDCEVTSASTRLDSIKRVVDNTSYPDVKTYGLRFEAATKDVLGSYEGLKQARQ